MATKHFCDGCGKEVVTTGDVDAMQIGYGPRPDRFDHFALCQGCLDDFRRHHLPTKWPRAVEQALASHGDRKVAP